MKNKFLILLTLCFFGLSSFTNDGGDPYHRSIDIDSYESALSLKYVGIHDTLSYELKDNKNKSKLIREQVTSNVAVYDIHKKSVNYVFKDKVVRQIVGFYYESEYWEGHNSVVFNENYEDTEIYLYTFRLVNNSQVAKRTLSSNMIIITEDPVSGLRIVWISDKYGNNVAKALEFNNSWNTEIDVNNQQFRIYRQTSLELEVKDVKY